MAFESRVEKYGNIGHALAQPILKMIRTIWLPGKSLAASGQVLTWSKAINAARQLLAPGHSVPPG